MAKRTDSYSDYIEALNTELLMGENMNSQAIYDAFSNLVENKRLLKQLIEVGEYKFEYILFITLLKDTLWEDGIELVIKIYRNAKQKDNLKAISWLNNCIQDFTNAGEKWTQQARKAYAPEEEEQRPDIALENVMGYIGGTTEGIIKAYLRFVNGCISIANGKEIKELKLGIMVQNLIDNSEIFKGVYCDILKKEKISDWRNAANHLKYVLQPDGNLEVILGNGEKERKKIFSLESIKHVAIGINALAYMNKIAIEMIKIDEIENREDGLYNKKKNIFKQRDDQIGAVVQLAVDRGMRLIGVDFEENEMFLIEVEFKEEFLEDFLYKMRCIFGKSDMRIFILKGNVVHYEIRLFDESGKIIVLEDEI